MWHIIKYELKYYWYYHTILIIAFLIYTTLALFDLQLTTAPEYEIDYWGGIYSIITYAFLFSVWGNRVMEKRIRLHSLLPVKEKQYSLARFSFAALPFIVIVFYLVIMHLMFINIWHKETGSLIGQLGVTLILFSAYLKTRDDWFSYWNFGKRVSMAFVTVLIIQVIVVFVFVEMESFKNGLVEYYGYSALNYATLIFPLLGFVILISSIYSLRKRRSFLS
jgi:hypothetical protein